MVGGERSNVACDDWVVPLAGATRQPALVGGKGANLIGLRRAGFNVPAGFCITTAAFRTAILARLKDADNLGGLSRVLLSSLRRASRGAAAR